MDWYSQPTGMGTFTSEGTEKLLGTPGVENLELLVRESAQNSWDAAFAGSIPMFGIDYRVLSEEQRNLLAEVVFSEGQEHTLLPLSLLKNELDVLEIWDRGTTGLDGPVRSDLTVPKDVPTNFIDLIYMIGSSNKEQSAGGNYGFGKSSAFKSSEAKAIVYWTVCYNESGNNEHRFIASGVSNEFDINGRNHVGRHWWGKRLEDPVTGETRLEPIVGSEARKLGEALFSRRFEGDETGTSILIIDPDELAMIGNALDDEQVLGAHLSIDKESLINIVSKRLSDVVMKHLWPKLVSNDVSRKMQIFANGVEITGPMASNYPYIGSYAVCLEAVRNKHESNSGSLSHPNVELVPILVGRKREVVGHLALTTGIDLASSSREGDGLVLDTDIPKNSVALMRDGAELVVKYMSGIQKHSQEVLYWTGVFKPCPEFDPDFAAAEPSSHDDWIVGSLQGSSKTRVKVSLRRIEEAILKFLGTNDTVKVPAGAGAGSVSALALELGRLVAVFGSDSEGGDTSNGGTRGSGASGDLPGRRTKGRRSTPTRDDSNRLVQVAGISLESITDQRNTHRVEIFFSGDWSKNRKFAVKPKVRIEGNAKAAGKEDHFLFTWPSGIIEESNEPNGETVLAMTEKFDQLEFEVSSPGHFSFDLNLEPRE